MEVNKEQEITLLYQLIEKHFGSGVLMQFEDLTETDSNQLLNRIETMINKKDLFGTIFNVANDDESANIRQAGLFYDVCKAYGIKVMGGNGRDRFMSAVGSGLVNLCIGNDNGRVIAFGRTHIPNGAVFGHPGMSMSDFKHITESDIQSHLDNLSSPKEPKRTKVEYVNIGRDWNAWEFLKAYSELPDSEQWFIKVSDDQYAPIHDWFVVAKTLRAHNLVYQRIETPIEWWEDANDLLGELANLSLDDDGVLQLTMEKGQVGFGMSRDKWCDFARILLEQGE